MKDKEKKANDKKDSADTDKFENTSGENSENQELKITKEEELKNKIEMLELELTSFKDKFLRKAAEFENYKRRTENDQLNLIKYGAEGFIRRILPVIDDFERSLSHIDNASEVGPIKDGIKLIYDKFMKILGDQGVKKIDAVGKEFDVHFHEALLQRKDPNVKPHTVLDEVETGYLYNDKVIRHSKVVVNEDTGTDETDTSDQNNNNEENN
jgi:molecular chaperone GrpE